MPANIEMYKKDLGALVEKGALLLEAIQLENIPERYEKVLVKSLGKDTAQKILNSAPAFNVEYQSWYSESKALVRQLLPDRLNDFCRYYEKPKNRKEITAENYTLEDCVQGLQITRGAYDHIVVGPEAGISLFGQQYAILKSIENRFESSLFDIQQLVQADLFDSETDAARELAKNKFFRSAGALAGVVLEKHLRQVCSNHQISFRKKTPTISDFNEGLKKAELIDLPRWRFISHLGDIRNLCDHPKGKEPTAEQISDLIDGVEKTVKTLF